MVVGLIGGFTWAEERENFIGIEVSWRRRRLQSHLEMEKSVPQFWKGHKKDHCLGIGTWIKRKKKASEIQWNLNLESLGHWWWARLCRRVVVEKSIGNWKGEEEKKSGGYWWRYRMRRSVCVVFYCFVWLGKF